MNHFTPPAGSIPTLQVPTLEGVRSVHLIGIGGAGMCNLARLLLARGIAVSGSDLKDSKGLRELTVAGAEVWVGHDGARMSDVDVVIISSAIAENNAELVEARERGLTVWARQQALAALSHGHRSIAIAGTHGKTTTTSMIGAVLEHAGLDPSYLIGGDLNESGSGARSGSSDLFVFEADESDGSFLLARPHVGVITNVEIDHVDFYTEGSEQIEAAFADFAAGCEHVIACGDDEGVTRALSIAGADAITYGVGPQNHLRLSIDELGPSGARGRVTSAGASSTPLALQVDGPHNLLNAVAAIGVGERFGVDRATSADALAGFRGVHRRFEHRGTARGAEFFDDYGQTATEMAVTIATARRRAPGRLIALVQPHRYSRVQAFWRELGASVADADLVLVTDVYGAAQEPIPGVTGRLVVDGVGLASPSTEVVYLPHRRDVVGFLEREVRPGDLVVTMGCGDVWMLGDAAMERIRETDA